MRIAPYLTALLVGLSTFAPPAAADVPRVYAPPLEAHVIRKSCPHDFGIEVNGCAYPETATIYIGTNPDPQTVEHELSHLYDHQVLTPGDRTYFKRIMGYAAHVPWSLEGDMTMPDEQFADARMSCVLGLNPQNSDDYTWGVASGYYAGPKRHHRVCNAIARIDARLTRSADLRGEHSPGERR